MKPGDVIRSRYGSVPLWRVDEVFHARSNPYVLATLLVEHNGEKPGTQRMLVREDYRVESDPKTYACRHNLVLDEHPRRQRTI